MDIRTTKANSLLSLTFLTQNLILIHVFTTAIMPEYSQYLYEQMGVFLNKKTTKMKLAEIIKQSIFNQISFCLM